jgi:hypothetical protein
MKPPTYGKTKMIQSSVRNLWQDKDDTKQRQEFTVHCKRKAEQRKAEQRKDVHC